MKVYCYVSAYTSPLVSRAIAFALEKRYPIVRSGGAWIVEVDDWPCWLRCVWHAFADLSLSDNAVSMCMAYVFYVVLENGNSYDVKVWWNSMNNGINYGSVGC